MNQMTDFAWDLFYRDDRFLVYRGRLEIVASLTLLGLGAVVAAAVRAFGHHWAQAAGIAFTFLAYSLALIGSLKVKSAWRAAQPPPPLGYFALAGSVAGLLASLLVQHPPFFFMATTASGILFGGAHWLAIRQLWRAFMHLLGQRPPGARAA